MEEEIIVVDMSLLLKLTNNIIVSEPSELKLIEFYSYYVTTGNNTLRRFTEYVLSKLYLTDTLYPYNEIKTFFSTKSYLHTVMRFMGLLDYLVLKAYKGRFENIFFSKIKEHTSTTLLVEFKVVVL